MSDDNNHANSKPDPRKASELENKADNKKAKWSLFGGVGKLTEAEKRLQRLEELRRDLYGGNSSLCEYAVNTLFTMLWMETASGRQAIACALSDAPPLSGKGEAPPLAARLCYRVQAPAADPLAVPLTPLMPPKGAKLREWADQTLLIIFTDALNTIKLLLRQTAPPDDTLSRESDVCQATLRLAAQMKSPALVEAALRLLRMFASDPARETGLSANQTPELRSLAALYFAALPPDALTPLWTALNSSDIGLRPTLLPVLDYFSDARAVPHLIKLLENHSQWLDGEMAAWAAVRALQRLRDRRALPVLRRLIAVSERAAAVALPHRVTSALNPALTQAVRRAIEAIENPRQAKERFFLLRPSQPDTTHLLRPAADTNRADTNRTELLRSEAEKMNHGGHGGHGED